MFNPTELEELLQEMETQEAEAEPEETDSGAA